MNGKNGMKKLYYNGAVYVGGGELAEAFVVENGRFGPVGGNSLLESYPAYEKTDLQGAFVCPGFNDSHMHLLGYGLILRQAPLHAHTESLADMLDCLRTFLARNPLSAGQWLIGRGFNQDYFKGAARLPSRSDLDGVSREIPILITRVCGHMGVVNSKALEILDIAENTAVSGGAVDLEEGRFYDNALELVKAKLPQPSKGEIKEMIVSAVKELNRRGVTSVQTDDYCVFKKIAPAVINEAYRELEREGALTVRICEQCNFTTLEELKSFVDSGEVRKGSELFRIGPVKLLGDGSLGSRTAHLTKPYKGSSEYGFSLFAPERLQEMISYAHRSGLQVIVHAIGDKCLDEVLEAFEKALKELPRPDHRYGIVHCQVTREDQLDRIARLGLRVYAQSVFLDYDNHIAEKLLDPELLKTSYSWKTLLEKGVSVSNGSDCPVEEPDCLKGIQLAVTRTSLDGTGPYLPSEAFTVAEALDSFTFRGAEASFEEKVKGRIKEGQLADFVILDKDPFKAAPEDIRKIKVVAAYLGGRKL